MYYQNRMEYIPPILMKSGTVFDEKWALYPLDDGAKVYSAVESVAERFAAKNGKEVAKFSHEGNGEIRTAFGFRV